MYQLEQQYSQYTTYAQPKTTWGAGNRLAGGWGLYGLMVFLAVVLFLTVISASAINNVKLTSVAAWFIGRDPAHYVRTALPVWVDPNLAAAKNSSFMADDLMAPVMAVLPQPVPLKILKRQLPLLAVMDERQPSSGNDQVLVMAPKLVPRSGQELKLTAPLLSPQNLVALYNTHTGETYALTDGVERLNGKRGGVVKVAAALEQELVEKHGIKVARSDEIHDAVYNSSYIQSQQTLRSLLEQNPDLQVVFDIHRDAGKSRSNSLVTVNEQQVAPVLIIVGSDARTSFPTWQKNHEFARELAAEINKQHPGLCIGVRIQEGRYNQFLHPRAVLLEIGSVSNSTDEAVASARLLAEPVAAIVKRYMDAAEDARETSQI